MVIFTGKMKLEVTLFAIISFSAVFSQPQWPHKCPGAVYCTCEKEIAKCIGKQEKFKLSYIPKFPKNIRQVVFTNNSLGVLESSTLRNLSDHEIITLILRQNNIQSVTKDSFLHMKYLKVLDLSRNNISTLDASLSFHSLPASIQKLKLNHMLWHPRDELFGGLNGSRLTRIELSHSYLTPFNGSWFKHLSKLESLDISWNSIQDIKCNFTGLSNLQILNLAGNWFNNVPDFCRDGLTKLRKLLMSSTKLYSLNALIDTSTCLGKLEVLNLAGISIRVIPNNAFSRLASLKKLLMNKMSTQLAMIRPNAFNSSSLEEIMFAKAGGFWFVEKMASKKLFDPRTLFKNCPNLHSLDLSHNVIEFTSKVIKDMFSPLKKLKRLWLESLSLTYIPKDLLHRFPLLEEISFERNFINPWTDGLGVFGENSGLKVINLARNQIITIYKSSFPTSLLRNVNKIDLSYNSFTCNCEIEWFRSILKQSKPFVNKTKITCADGKTAVLDYNPSFLECHVLEIATSIGCSVAVIVFSVLTVYFCRWRIRYKLYHIRAMRKGYERLDGNEFKYSAYVIYTEENLTWVKDNLIPKLEKELGFKLCIPHRDFLLGKVMSDNIVEHMYASRTVLPILSNSFGKDEWCLFQLAVARNRLTRQGDLSIFPIMLEEIEFKYMNAALYHTIKMSHYAAWSNDESGRVLFWEQLRDHFQTSI